MSRTLTGRNSDRLGASQADLAEFIRGAAVRNHRLHALAVLGVRHHGAASHHHASDSPDDHRRHHDKGHRRGIDIFEWRRTRQRLSILAGQMQGGRRNESPRTRISGTLDNRMPVLLSSVRHDAKPVARTAGIREHIQCLARVALRRITRRFAKLTIRAVSIELRPCGEGHAPVVLFHNVTAFDVSDDSAHNLSSFVCCVFQLRSASGKFLARNATPEPKPENSRTRPSANRRRLANSRPGNDRCHSRLFRGF